jgi:hypothetical protein
MTLNELLAKLSELKKAGTIPDDAPVILRLGVLKGKVRTAIEEEDEFGLSIVTFSDDAIELEVENEPEAEDESPVDSWALVIRGGPQLEIPPVL